MRMLILLLLLISLAGGYLLYYMISTVEHDPALWHIDPLTAETSTTPNDFRLAPEGTAGRVDQSAPTFSGSAAAMATAWDAFVIQQSNTVRIAGTPEELHMTYVQRTQTLKMPDYISVKFIPLTETTSTIAIYSRSRYGYGDLGVNKARIENWLTSLSPFAPDPA